MQNMADADVVAIYGRTEPMYGGVYFDGDILVAMFTEDLERHRTVLASRLGSPEQFRVVRADRSEATVNAINHRIQRRLQELRIPHLIAYGMRLHEGQFRMQVDIEGSDENVIAAIHEAVAPEPVVVRCNRTRPHRLPRRRTGA